MEPQGPTPAEGPQGTPGAERRLAPRYPASVKVVCYPVGGGLGERRTARVRNVSRTGIGLSVDRSFGPGTALIVELPVEEGVKHARCKVVHSTRQMGGTYLLGCAFDQQISDAEVRALSS